MSKKFFFQALMVLLSLTAFSQNNYIIDEFLAKEKADFGTSALLVLQSAELVDDYAKVEDAKLYLVQEKWFTKDPDMSQPATLGKVSLLIMRAFQMKGGLFYSIHPSARYAARELSYRGAVYGTDRSPNKVLSGYEVLMMVNWALDQKERNAK